MTIERYGFSEKINNICQSTKDSGHIIGQSMEELLSIIEGKDKLQTTPIDPPIKVKYKNWKGEIGIRTIIPEAVWYGSTEFHKENQWLMDVWDVNKNAQRTYAMMDIIEFIKEDNQSNKTCIHTWRVNPYDFVEGCIGAICIKCGKRGCGCDVENMTEEFWNKDEAYEFLNQEKNNSN